MFLEYIVVFKYILFAIFLSLVLFSLSFFMVFQTPNAEKLSSYECGFNPWGDASSKFEMSYYLVAILFIIFDLEITFLYPWTVSHDKMNYFAFYSVMFFLLVLTLGFMYEWMKGALDWE